MKVSVQPADDLDSNSDRRDNVEKAAMDQHLDCEDEDVYDVYTRSAMFQAMKPLFYSLRLFGLHHRRKYGSVKDCNMRVTVRKCGMKRASTDSRKPCVTVSMGYSWVMFTLFMINYLRYFWVFAYGDNSFGPEFFVKCTFVLWHSLAIVSFIVFLRATCRYDCLPKFFIEWESLVKALPYLDLGKAFVRRSTLIVMSLSWLLVLGNALFISYFGMTHPEVTEPMFSPMQVGNEHLEVMQIILVITIPSVCAVWSFGIAIDFIFCYILYKMFQLWCERFRAKCAADITTAEFVEEQLSHQKICRLVNSAEEFLSLYKAMSFVCNIGMILFLLYSFVYMSALPAGYSGPVMIGSAATWTVIGVIALTATCASGVMVNAMAHSVFDDVVELQSTIELPQIQLFLTRLSGSSIGLSALGMFVFDKTAILTAIGMLLSYFIVMLQFNPGSSSATSCLCNCTSG